MGWPPRRNASPSRGGRRSEGALRRSILAAASLLVVACVRRALEASTSFAAAGDPRSTQRWAAPAPRGDHEPPLGDVPPLSGRRGVVGAGLAGVVTGQGPSSALAAAEPKVTARCTLDVRIGPNRTSPLRRVVIGLFGEEAPVLTSNFAKACSGTYDSNGLQAQGMATYQLSRAKSVAKDRMIWFADFPGGNWMRKTYSAKVGGTTWEKKLPLAGPDTKTEEVNSLRHDVPGRVGMAQGGETFNFVIAPVPSATWLDETYVVVGQVVEGLDVVKEMNEVPVQLLGGPANALPGSKEADDFLKKPIKKIQVMKASLAPA